MDVTVNYPAQQIELSEVYVLMMIGGERQGRGQRAATPELNRLPQCPSFPVRKTTLPWNL